MINMYFAHSFYFLLCPQQKILILTVRFFKDVKFDTFQKFPIQSTFISFRGKWKCFIYLAKVMLKG